MEAQDIYGELYKVGDTHPFELLNKVFASTKQKLHSSKVGDAVANLFKDMNGQVKEFQSPAKKLSKNTKQVKSKLPNIANVKKVKAGKKINTVAKSAANAGSGSGSGDDEDKVKSDGTTTKSTSANADNTIPKSKLQGDPKIKKGVNKFLND